MPVVPLRGLVVMPYTLLSFDAGRDKSVAAIETAAENDGLVFLTAQKDPKLTDITAKQLYEIGCICKIKQVIKLPGDTVRVMAEGVCRALVDGFTGEEPFSARTFTVATMKSKPTPKLRHSARSFRKMPRLP